MKNQEDKNLIIYQPPTVNDTGAEGNSFLRSTLYILFRRKKTIIGTFAAIVLLAAATGVMLPKKYESEAKLLVRVGRENASIDPSVVGPTMSIQQNRDKEVNSEVSTIRSRIVAEQVVDSLGLSNLNPEDESKSLLGEKDSEEARNGTIKKVMKNLKVYVENQTSIIHLSYIGSAPGLAQMTLDSIVEVYLDRHIDVHKAQASPKFFQEKLASLEAILRLKENELEKYKEQNAISSMEAQKGKLIEQISLIEREVDAVGSQISASGARIKALNTALIGRAPRKEVSRVTGRSNKAAEALKEKLIGLQLKEADLAARYPDHDRALIDVRKQIELANLALSKEVDTHTEITTAVDSNFQSIELAVDTEKAQINAFIAQRDSLRRKLENRKEKLGDLSEHEIALGRLQRALLMAENEYVAYRENLQRAKISADLDSDKVSNISIVQPPTQPVEPASPNLKLIALFGLLAGLFSGIVAALICEYFDGSLKTPEEVNSRLGLPVLVSVSQEEFKSCI